MISHNLDDVGAVADRVVVLRHGRNNGVFQVASTTAEQIHHAMTGAVPTRNATPGVERAVVTHPALQPRKHTIPDAVRSKVVECSRARVESCGRGSVLARGRSR